jgi:hypothetical protein
MAQDLELAGQRPVVRERAGVVLALVLGQGPRRLAGARDPGRRAHVAANGDPIVSVALGTPDARLEALGRPGRLGAPFAPHLRKIRCRPRRPAYEDLKRRLLVDPVRVVPQPASEPADELGHEVYVRPGDRRGRRRVGPRPDDHATRAAQRLVGAERDVRVPVGPAGDHQRRAPDQLVARTQGPVPP